MTLYSIFFLVSIPLEIYLIKNGLQIDEHSLSFLYNE